MQDLDEVPSARCFVEDLLTKTSSMCTRSVNLVKSECTHQFTKIASNPWRVERGEELLKVEFPLLHKYWTVKMTKRRTGFFKNVFFWPSFFLSFDKGISFYDKGISLFLQRYFWQRYFVSNESLRSRSTDGEMRAKRTTREIWKRLRLRNPILVSVKSRISLKWHCWRWKRLKFWTTGVRLRTTAWCSARRDLS